MGGYLTLTLICDVITVLDY